MGGGVVNAATWGAAPWLVFIAALWLRSILNRGSRVRKASLFFVVPAGLTFIAGAAMAEIAIGDYAAQAMRWGANTAAEWMQLPASNSPGGVGGPILALAALGFAAAVGVGLSDMKADKKELRYLLWIPTLCLAAAGQGVTTEGSKLAATALNIASHGLGSLLT